MTNRGLGLDDRIGLIHPQIDAHTLGLSSIGDLFSECGIFHILAPSEINEAANRPREPGNARLLADWIRGQRLTAIGFSYRLDPDNGLELFIAFMETLTWVGLTGKAEGTVRAVFFAGLPRTCDLIEAKYPEVTVFRGNETPSETFELLGFPRQMLPSETALGAEYDESRLAFARGLIQKDEFNSVRPIDRSGYRHYGARGDSVIARVAHGKQHRLPPLMRAHAGPFLPDRKEAVSLFLDWAKMLAKDGFLDVLSIGTSQLSQSEFGRDWGGLPDGGGVPLARVEEFRSVWEAARPMLVRSYAGTRDVEAMARMLEENIDNAWHALSLWWFSQIDGRGPNSVRDNLRQHVAALKYIASIDKPFEPNVPHHFAFRGGDDLTYVLSGLVAAKAAKAAGIQRLILQVMLNTPRSTSGIADLAKARALLHLVRELEDGDFKVYLQPRGGLDYFSGDKEKAKAQLAAVTALMDDIEPFDPSSPEIIHVVSYSEGYELADPAVIGESIRITRYALEEYRRARIEGSVADMASNGLVIARTSELLRDARSAIAAIESSIREPYSADGLYEILASGFFAVPGLMECREEFAEATRWKTRQIHGTIRVVGDDGKPVAIGERLGIAQDAAKRRAEKRLTRRRE